MHTPHLLGVALVVLGLVACSSGTTGSGAGTDPPVGGGTGASGGAAGKTGAGLAGVAPKAGGSATCDDACAYYLQCKGEGWDTTTNRSQCDQNCASLGVSAEQLASYVTLDCPTAISVIEPAPAPSSSGGTSGSSGSTDCNGCSWDGSSCIYLTGSGGNYFACASSCCGH